MDDIPLSIDKPAYYAEAKEYKPKNEKVNQHRRKPKKTYIPKGGGGRRFLSKGKYE
jgi:hypothetical protein